MALKKNTGGLVYSSEHGRMCPGCSRPVKECACVKNQQQPPADGVVRVSRQTKGRKGKGVTLITGVPLDEAGLKALATRLKQRCGSGGTVKDGIIEIQGDHCDLLVEELKKQGWTVKRAGG
ncbi:MAG: translation initiation factor Sui1 [Syntrophotaleaceae bacterium]